MKLIYQPTVVDLVCCRLLLPQLCVACCCSVHYYYYYYYTYEIINKALRYWLNIRLVVRWHQNTHYLDCSPAFPR